MRRYLNLEGSFIPAIIVLSICAPQVHLATFTDYDDSIAREALLYSSVSYCGNAAMIKKWNCTVCQLAPFVDVMRIFSDSTTDAFGFVGVEHNPVAPKIIIAFRGTIFNNLAAVEDDIKYLRVRWPEFVKGSEVHRGFLEYFESIEKPLRDGLKKALELNPSYDVWVTGHSLGASAAVIAAVALRDLIPRPVLYTFGTPRVGNYQFAQYANSLFGGRSFRVIHANDVVCHLPTCSWFGGPCSHDGYHPYHIATAVVYEEDMNDGNYTICSRTDGEKRCSGVYYFPSISMHRYYFGMAVGQVCPAEGFASTSPMVAVW